MLGLSIALLGVWQKPQQKPSRVVGGFIAGAIIGVVGMLVGVSFGRGLQGESMDLGRALQALRESAGSWCRWACARR